MAAIMNPVQFITGQNWITTTQDYSLPLPDEIIDAYLAGKKAMVSEINEFATKQFLNLLGKAMKKAIEFKQELGTEEIEVSDIFLKVASLDCFEAALVIPDDVYLSEKQLDLLSRASEIEDIMEADELLNIEFRFLPQRENLNRKKLFSNGFTFQYEPNGAEA